MAQFTFQLQPLLRHRERAEHERQRDLAVANAEFAAAREGLLEVERTVVAALKDLRENRLTGPINLPFLTAHRRFMLAMQRRGAERMERMRAAQAKVDFARRALAEAAKQRKAIETLRDQQHERWRVDRERRETVTGDEIATQMAVADLAAGAESPSMPPTVFDYEDGR